MSKDLQDALNYAGSSIITLSCIVSGLASQLKAGQGTAAVEAAHEFALEVAKVYPSAPGVAPDVKAITKFFNGHK
ncbi:MULTISPECIES: hypothetical protein [Pseudomonas]|uniref:hypothetical protein n=1 Tax=Pseudomonas TaxID=286 RepID=UPI0005ABC87F|nr:MULTISPECIES: hypothetical protein [Pseudomonas]KIQ08377.1 hypothetical protein RU03_22745 [Pseudomonas simiae]WLG72158.1 hypothetical protein PSH60_18545 [Pseudomonas simiae]SFA83528.1 hypothetical protein SAMN05216248_101722 [Pseudomonas simiae]